MLEVVVQSKHTCPVENQRTFLFSEGRAFIETVTKLSINDRLGKEMQVKYVKINVLM